MLAAVVALVAAALAVPAMAQNNGGLVNFADCFPFCDDNSEARQDADQGARQAFDQEARDFDRFDDEDEFFDFFDDRFDDEEEFFDFFDDRFDNGFGGAEDEAVVSNEIGQESESGDVSIGFSVDSSGDYAQQCIAPLQFGNTGNLQNAQGFAQYNSEVDDIEFGGSSFEFSPELAVSCDQAVQQSAAASSR